MAVVFRRFLHDLTPEHQFYWKGKQAKGKCKVVKEYYENLIQGRWVFPRSFFSAFLLELKWINKLTSTIFGQSLFREGFEADKRPRDFTFFFVPTLKNYQNFVLLLDKMLSDNINKSFFESKGIALYKENELRDGKVERISKGTIALLEEWLTTVYTPVTGASFDPLFDPLKNIRRQRQRPAHKIDPDRYDKSYSKMQAELIESAYEVLRTFRMIFQEHRDAHAIIVPDSLDNAPVKPF
ncbi:hypothetical protein MKQ68_01705 [Chitinophaga horti]|uniref:Cthe-2314-like HEPN domain-containing protein n=1 Tax=Chitinophaga horti TaxID=2920382 RepID=A0ABY6J6A0_9BACT|nr:hypothetical protein [Chitinophaga horti]UYQ93809.1 hypothetical protein MKQ68_01705 [Chitinophaga horti]